MGKKLTAPEVRQHLGELAEELRSKGLEPFAEKLEFLRDQLVRERAVRRARPKSRPLTPELAEDIRQFAARNPELHQREIGTHFNVNPGRVSEALNNLK